MFTHLTIMMSVPLLRNFLPVLTIGCKNVLAETTYTAETGIHVNEMTLTIENVFLKSVVFLKSLI